MNRLLSILLIASAASFASTQKDPISIGDSVDVTALKNQHGESFDNPSTIELLLYVNGMAARDIVLPTLESIDITCMNEGRVAYVADISRMPSLVSKFIAVPRMRDYAYPVWLDYDGESTERLPRGEAGVSLMDIEQGKVTRIEFINEASRLTERLKSRC